MVHLLEEHRIYILHCDGSVHVGLRQAYRLLYRCYLGGAGGDKENSYLFARKTRFLHRLLACQTRSLLHRGVQRQNMGNKIRETDPYKPAHGGTRGGNNRLWNILLLNISSCRLGDQLGTA